MVQVVVLNANGESRTLKTAAISGAPTGAAVAKAFRKTKPATLVGSYSWNGKKLQVWGWQEGKAGTENKHELPPPLDEGLLFGDALVAIESGMDFTVDDWNVFYDSAFGGFEDIDGSDDDDEDEEVEDAEDESATSAEESEESDAEEEEAEDEEDAEDAEVEEEEEEADDGFDDEDGGGGSKRRAPRRRAMAAPEYRRIEMGVRSRIKVPAPLTKRAPKWQTAPELEEEAYD
jgi:hypothetical protein